MIKRETKNKYRELSEKEKDIKREYGKKTYIIICLKKKTKTERISKKL